jgi:hypothetical protein
MKIITVRKLIELIRKRNKINKLKPLMTFKRNTMTWRLRKQYLKAPKWVKHSEEYLRDRQAQPRTEVPKTA